MITWLKEPAETTARNRGPEILEHYATSMNKDGYTVQLRADGKYYSACRLERIGVHDSLDEAMSACAIRAGLARDEHAARGLKHEYRVMRSRAVGNFLPERTAELINVKLPPFPAPGAGGLEA